MSLPGFLVVGTDTGVGKTQVAAAIARCLKHAGRRVGVLKPVATGVAGGDPGECKDAEILIESIGGPAGVEARHVTPIALEAPLAPSVAARLAGRPLEMGAVLDAAERALDWWAERAEVIIIEGVGGLLCPLAEGATVADLAIALDLPLVIVARRGLGTLNHTLLTVEAAQTRGLRIAWVVLNAAQPVADPLVESTTPEELCRRLDRVGILAGSEHLADPAALWNAFRGVDWYGWARPPRRLDRPRPAGPGS